MPDSIEPESLMTASPESNSAITSALSSEASSSHKPRLKRNRIILSCQPCHRRKQQCDRGHPCQRCVNRGSIDLCVYEQPKELGRRKLAEIDVSNDVPDRVTQLERLVSQTLNSLEPSALAGIDALLQMLHASNPVIASTSHMTPHVATTSHRATDHAVQMAAAALGQLSQQDPTDPSTPFGPIAGYLHNIRGSGSMPDLQSHFPNHKITTFLLTHYFERSSVHWRWPIIHRPGFENCYQTFASGALPPSLEFTGLLAIVCATALQFLPESEEDETTFADFEHGRHVLKQRLLQFSRAILLQNTPHVVSSIERIQGLFLFSMYQWNEGFASESYYIASLTIRMAQTLAMHRDGLTVWRMRPRDAEIRRRIWWNLYIIDRFHSMEYRRPYIISDHFGQHIDVSLPLNLDQDDLLDGDELVGKPLDEPTDSLFHVLQCQFSQLVGQICDRCFSISLPTYQTVIDLDEKIRKFELELPALFRYQSTQVALARPYLQFQNQSLTLQTCCTRAQLLRPFLFLRPGSQGQETEQERRLAHFHKLARVMCLLFCKRILAMIQLCLAQSCRVGVRRSLFALSIFEAALTLSIAIIMNPHSPENEELAEWITLSQALLHDVDPYNPVADNARQHLEVIRKRVYFVLSLAGQNTPTLPFQCETPSPADLKYALQRLDRATHVLSLSQSSLSDVLGTDQTDDTRWSTLCPAVFAGHFPGMESLSGPVDAQNLEHFLDSCLSMQ